MSLGLRRSEIRGARQKREREIFYIFEELRLLCFSRITRRRCKRSNSKDLHVICTPLYYQRQIASATAWWEITIFGVFNKTTPLLKNMAWKYFKKGEFITLLSVQSTQLQAMRFAHLCSEGSWTCSVSTGQIWRGIRSAFGRSRGCEFEPQPDNVTLRLVMK